MLVAIEGMDGVGKTSVVGKICADLNIKKVEKPGQQIFNLTSNEEKDLIYKLYNYGSNDLTAWYYLMCYMTIKKQYKDEDLVIMDRNFLSTFYYDFNKENSMLFDSFVKTDGAPDMTIILYASLECRLDRIKKRDNNDSDLKKDKVLINGYDRYIEGIETYKIPYMIINTDFLSLDEVIEICKIIIYNIKENNFENIVNLQKIFSITNLNLSKQEVEEMLEALFEKAEQKKLTIF